MTELKVSPEIYEQIKKLVDFNGDPITITVEKKKWEPPAGRFAFGGDFSLCDRGYTVNYDSSYVKAGMTRATKEQAEADAKELRAFARLLAYRAEVAPGFNGEVGYALTKSSVFGLEGVRVTAKLPGRVIFPTEEMVRECLRKINSGELEL